MEGTRVLWKESTHRLRTTLFSVFRWIVWWKRCFWKALFVSLFCSHAFLNFRTQISRPLAYGVRISSKASPTTETRCLPWWVKLHCHLWDIGQIWDCQQRPGAYVRPSHIIIIPIQLIHNGHQGCFAWCRDSWNSAGVGWWTPRKYVFDITSISQCSSPWTCKLNEIRDTFHLECKLHFPSAQLMLWQMHLANASESIEAKFWRLMSVNTSYQNCPWIRHHVQ